MHLRKFIFAFFLLFCAEYASGVKTCSSWQDYWNFFGANSCRENLDASDEFIGIVGRWGKEVETHEITTYDGYILTLYRIVADQPNASPVLILHGIFMNSLAMVDRGPKSLAYQFVDNGYDVWILNWRGTKYSKGHIALKPHEAQYWKFGLDEMAMYDLPQAIMEIRSITNKKILVVGFEIGNTIAIIYSTMYPDAAEQNLNGVVSLSPTGPPNNVGLLSKAMLYAIPVWTKPLLLYFYHGEVPALYINLRASFFCRHSGIWFARFCDAYFMLMSGLDLRQQDPETLPVIVALNKDSNSLMTFEHFYQMALSKRFQQFDHGTEKNKIIYGTKNPPEYDLARITVPQLFFVGKNDKSGTLQDATVMYQQIPVEHQKEFHVIEYENFGLADFVQAKDINRLLHPHLMASVTDFVPPVPSQ